MNAFAAESAAAVQAAARKIRDAGREITLQAHGVSLTAVRPIKNDEETRSRQITFNSHISLILQQIFAAEKAVEELKAALKSVTKEDANA